MPLSAPGVSRIKVTMAATAAPAVLPFRAVDGVRVIVDWQSVEIRLFSELFFFHFHLSIFFFPPVRIHVNPG